ncbi:unnamed protein product [Auanema sp. JU1783]|nr:unnamed protein product [Auanema sp. JU1783]
MIMFTLSSSYQDSGYNSPCSPSTSTSFDTPFRSQRIAGVIRRKLDFSASPTAKTVNVATQTVCMDLRCQRIARRLSFLCDEFDREYFQKKEECPSYFTLRILENVIKLLF